MSKNNQLEILKVETYTPKYQLLMQDRRVILEKISNKASEMVKDHDQPVEGGMTEVPFMYLRELDDLLFELDKINGKIYDEIHGLNR